MVGSLKKCNVLYSIQNKIEQLADQNTIFPRTPSTIRTSVKASVEQASDDINRPA